MLRTWFRQLRKQLPGGTSRPEAARRKPRPVRPAVEFLETRELLSGSAGLIGGGLVGDPPDPVDKGPKNQVHVTVVREDALTSLSASQWDVNQPYAGTVANFGSAQATLMQVDGLPAGLTATKSGSTISLTGTPTQTGPFSIGLETRQVSGNNETDYEGSYTLTINPALSLGRLSAAPWTARQAGSSVISVSGGTPAYSNLSVTGLPPGVTATLSANAITLSGTPTQAGTFDNIMVSLQDGAGVTVNETCGITVGLGLSPGTLPGDVAGRAYSATFGATGGSGRYNFALASGVLPAGLSLSRAGVLSGTPTVAGTYGFTVQATDASGAGVSGTQAYTLAVSPAAAVRLAFTTQPPAAVVADTLFQTAVQAVDAYGNGVPGVFVTVSSPAVQTNLGRTTAMTDSSGHAVFSLWSKTVPGSYTLTASAPGVAATSNAFTVLAGAAESIVVNPSTNAPVAGNSFNVTITLEDFWGNTSDFNGPVTLSSSDGQLAPTTVACGHGTATASFTLDIARSLTLTATASGGWLQGTSSSITVKPAAPSQVVFLTQPSASVMAGSTFSAVVQVQDPFGNLVPGTPVGMSISPGVLSGGATSVTTNGQGQAAFSLSENASGTYRLIASVSGLAGVSSNAFTVTPAAIAVVVNPSTTTPTAGTPFTVTITARDPFGNGYTGPATITSSDGLSQVVQLANGSGSISVTRTVAHAVTLTATVGQASSSSKIVVSPAALSRFGLSASSTTGFTNDTIHVTASAQDRFGNTVSYNGAVALASSNGAIVSSTSVQLTNGSGQISLKLAHSGTVMLSASSGSITSNAVTITVSPSLYLYSWTFFALDANGDEVATRDYTNLFANDALAANDQDVALQLWAQSLSVNWYSVGWRLDSKTAAN